MQHNRRHIKDGTFAAVIRDYLRSPKFASLSDGTRKGYLRHLQMVESADHLGGLSVYVIRPKLVQDYIDGFAEFPGKQKNVLSVLLAVQKWAAPRDRLPHPITTGVQCLDRDGGHAPWTDSQIALAERHARQDLARVVTLMAHTGQRGSDVVKMRWSDIESDNGVSGINVVQVKTGRQLWIPLEEELKAAMKKWERKPPFFLVLSPFSGEPYKRENLSWHWNKHRDTNVALAPLSGLALHGLRASRVVRLRKRGATELQIENVVGMSAPMVKRYCRLADQRSMAVAAFHQLNPGTVREQPQTNNTKTPWLTI
jgi:integrase